MEHQELEIFELVEKKLTEEKESKTIEKLKAIQMGVAIVFPRVLTAVQLNDSLKNAKKEDIPEEILNINQDIYIQYVKAYHTG